MSKLFLLFALAFTPTAFLATTVHAADVPNTPKVSSGSPTVQLVARRYTARRGSSSSRTPNYLSLIHIFPYDAHARQRPGRL